MIVNNDWDHKIPAAAPLLHSFVPQGIGPMDGSVSRIPDRRIDAMHTLYRDAQAPLKGRPMMDGRWCGECYVYIDWYKVCVYIYIYI